MKRFDFRTLIGIGMILLGSLLLLDKIGIVHGAASLFFGGILLLAAAYFLYYFFQGPQRHWWAVIPSFALFGMAAGAILPGSLGGLAGGIFLGALGLSFMIVYITDRSRWWGIIPGGVLLTLALVAVVDKTNLINSGSLFFGGLGLTFLLVAILPNPVSKMQWAYIPATVLILMGALLASQVTAGIQDYIWPIALIVAGLVVILSFFTKRV